MEVRESIEINAAPSIIWQVLTDVERWPEWTASVERVRRPDDDDFRIGSDVIIKQPRFPETRWRVTELDAGRSFTWKASAPGFKSVAVHTIEERDERRSRVELAIRQTGLLGLAMGFLTARITRRYVEIEAQGLKRRAEELTALEQSAEVR